MTMTAKILQFPLKSSADPADELNMNATTTTDTDTLISFEVGATYTTGRGDYVWHFEVLKRTAKFITIREVLTDEVKRVGVRVFNFGGLRETAYPHGDYSQCAVISADRKAPEGETVGPNR